MILEVFACQVEMMSQIVANFHMWMETIERVQNKYFLGCLVEFIKNFTTNYINFVLNHKNVQSRTTHTTFVQKLKKVFKVAWSTRLLHQNSKSVHSRTIYMTFIPKFKKCPKSYKLHDFCSKVQKIVMKCPKSYNLHGYSIIS